ncbi:MAG: hypothetical protein GX963_12320 [Bacteroidales bacterium]|nr:hypothetical protein [Bacteroidales bacterium]
MEANDHYQTASHGRQGLSGQIYREKQASYIDKKRFDKAMEMDIKDIKSKFGTKYDSSMVEAIETAKSKGLINNSQAKRLKKMCK